MGINVTANNATSELRLIAGAAINAGDLIVNSENGSAFAASNVLTVAQNNNTTAGSAALYAFTAQAGTTGYGGASGQCNFSSSIAQLGDGTIAMAYIGDGTTATTGVTLLFRNLQGAAPYATVAVTTDTSINNVRVKKLGSTQVLVAWIANAVMKFAIYLNNGTLVKAATTVATQGNNDTKGWNVEVIPSGDFVFAYRKVTSSDLEFQRFNSAGTLQGSATTVDAGAQPQYISILPQSSGGFLLFYYRNAATAGHKFARYDASGVLQGSLTTVTSSSAPLNYVIVEQQAIELVNGNVVLMTSNSSNYPTFYVYSSTGTLVAGPLDPAASTSTYAQTSQSFGMCATSSGFALLSRGSSSSPYLYTYNVSGAALTPRTQLVYGSMLAQNAPDPSAGLILINNGNAGFAVFTSSYASACSTNYATAFWTFSSTGATVGTPIVIQGNTNAQNLLAQFAILTSDGSVVVTQNRANQGPCFATYAIARKSVIGVAQEPAALNATFRVATSGTYALTSNFSTGGNFDQRAATVPGTRGTVAGANAILFGMS